MLQIIDHFLVPFGLVTAISACPLPCGPFMRTNSILCDPPPEKSPIIILWATLLLKLACEITDDRVIRYLSRLKMRSFEPTDSPTHPCIVNPFQGVVSDRPEKNNRLPRACVISCDQLHTNHLAITNQHIRKHLKRRSFGGFRLNLIKVTVNIEVSNCRRKVEQKRGMIKVGPTYSFHPQSAEGEL